MKWALLIFIVYGSHVTITTLPMQDELLCLRAAERLRLQQTWINEHLGLSCVQVAE